MLWFSLVSAVLVALAILSIGARYLTAPWAMAPSFGLPPPDADPRTTAWLRLKGVREVASGVVVLALLPLHQHTPLGGVLLALALIPLGDMTVVLTCGGRRAAALGIHGVTAAWMILAAPPLLAGVGG